MHTVVIKTSGKYVAIKLILLDLIIWIILLLKYHVSYDELDCRTTFTCIKCIHMLSVLRHILAHMCYHQEVFVWQWAIWQC